MLEQTYVRMRDGIRLAVDLHLPDAERWPHPRPVLLEALPYRKDDLLTHESSYLRLCAEGGFVVCRADLRGTGSSEGRATDEYPPTELDDLNDLIDWLAAQAWSTGRVGMFGWSYSGFNSLQVACTRPPALKAICAVYATDDRYTDDVHYMGGVLRAVDLVDYCHYMTATNALPPVPALFGTGWRDEWLARLDEHEPWLLRWTCEQNDGPYWRHGSLRPGYERIECATMLMGGWADGYRNNTLRTFAALQCPKSLLLGPWGHVDPASGRPGPHIDDVPEMIRWFDRWLGGDADDDGLGGNGLGDEPPIRYFRRRSTRPEPDLAMHAGDWQFEDSWPSARCRDVVYGASALGGWRQIPHRADVGTAAWISCAGGLPWGQPADQRADDAWSLTFEWPVGDEPIEILGLPSVAATFSSDQPVAYVSARLCDVFPDGTSALVTRGTLNLTHRERVGTPVPLASGAPFDASVELETTSWMFAAGHRIRLALSVADWPNTWNPPSLVVLQIEESSLALTLPTIVARSPHPAPEFTAPPAVEIDAHDDESLPPVWRIERDVLGRSTTVITRYGGAGQIRFGGSSNECYDGAVTVSTADPSAGSASATTRYELAWPEATVAVEARLRFRSDAADFHVEIDLNAWESGDLVRQRTWRESFRRADVPAAQTTTE